MYEEATDEQRLEWRKQREQFIVYQAGAGTKTKGVGEKKEAKGVAKLDLDNPFAKFMKWTPVNMSIIILIL